MQDARTLGAIIAGGQSRRFGSDKALAQIDGKCLIDHVAEALAAETDALILCGRSSRTLPSIPDRPAPGLGPLGGICAALHFARAHGFTHVLTAPVDVHPFPHDLAARLAGNGPRFIADQFLIGCWPTELAPLIEQHLCEGERSMRSWIARCDGAACDIPGTRFNLNSRNDWAMMARSQAA